MAEKALFSIATGITQILGSLAKEELVLLLGVEDELEKLKNTVSTIEAVLLDAEKQQQGSHAVKTWLAQLEDIFYDADDLLDDISTESLQREVMKDKKGKKNWMKHNGKTFLGGYSKLQGEIGERVNRYFPRPGKWKLVLHSSNSLPCC